MNARAHLARALVNCKKAYLSHACCCTRCAETRRTTRRGCTNTVQDTSFYVRVSPKIALVADQHTAPLSNITPARIVHSPHIQDLSYSLPVAIDSYSVESLQIPASFTGVPCFPSPSLQFLTLAHAPSLRTYTPVTSVFIKPFNEDERLLRTTKPRRVPISTSTITSRLHVDMSLHEHASQHLIMDILHSSPHITSFNPRVSPQASRATSTSRVYDVILPHRQPPQQRWLCVCPIATFTLATLIPRCVQFVFVSSSLRSTCSDLPAWTCEASTDRSPQHEHSTSAPSLTPVACTRA